VWKSGIKLCTEGEKPKTVEKKFSTVQKLSTGEKGKNWSVNLLSHICTGVTYIAISVIFNRSQELWS
jgi:hypothetical protein